MRSWAPSIFPVSLLGMHLFCGLIPSVSLADVSLAEKRPAISVPAAEIVLEASPDTKSNQLAIRSMFAQSGRRTCFSVEDQQKVQDHDDKSAWLAPLTMGCAGLITAVDETGWSGYEAKGDHARSNGNWSEARESYARAVELLDRTTAQESTLDMASLLNKVGAMHSKQHDHAGAEMAHRRALTIYTSIGGAEDLRVADTLDLLATVLGEELRNRALAGPLFFRVWAIRERVLGPEHPAVADSLDHLAFSLYADDLSMAMQLFVRSMEIRIRVFGPNHPSVADSLSAMALMYEMHQHRDWAIPLYQQALTIREKVFGLNSSETLEARSHLDMAHRWMDHPDQDPYRRE